jgi:hypothetical protein
VCSTAGLPWVSRESPKGDGAWVKGGFVVSEPALFEYVDRDATVREDSASPAETK